MAHAAQRHSDWSPDWATHPGEHLAEYLEVRGWNQAEFARIADLTPKLVNTIIRGTNPVTPDTAIKLERVLGLKAYVWTNLQSTYDIWQSREAEKSASAERKSWLARFPVKELRARGALPVGGDEAGLANCLMSLLGIGGPDSFDAKVGSLAVLHRQSKSKTASPHHIVTWLMLGEQKAREMDVPDYDEERFKQAVAEIRAMTVEPPEVFEPRMVELCRACGVALVFEKQISKTALFGSARWLDADHAIIQMSLRMKSNDHFWWTFFHEAAHILLHRGRNFADDQNGVGDGLEDEADRWAEEMLVGSQRFAQLKATQPRSAAAVTSFASEAGVHPGIVVGMLQHAGILPHDHLNGLKARFEWADEMASQPEDYTHAAS
jgi:HTH-type transcriptional regulator/antitoxin HigA